MRTILCHVLSTILIASFLLTAFSEQIQAAQWNQFRGSGSQGLDTSRTTPISWNVESGKNVLWKAPVPGLAHSAPIIWDDRIYITTAIGPGEPELKVGLYGDIGAAEDMGHHQWRLLAFDRTTGKTDL